MFRFLTLFLLIAGSVSGNTSLRTLKSSLDPYSVSQNLAFYHLFPDSSEGRDALGRALTLLGNNSITTTHALSSLPSLEAVNAMVSLSSSPMKDPSLKFTHNDIKLILEFGSRLGNRKLKGHRARTEKEVLSLPTEEIDIARALFLSEKRVEWDVILNYEALIDLMALEILAKLPPGAAPKDKIRGINRYIFEEREFRFPPHSVYAKDIDLYTFLPSVLDSRRGVCLGVSLLYLALAQRLDLPLEIITPPGHIYIRHPSPEGEINIETTARGINVESEAYLGINTRKLQQRTMKEVVGLAHINRASVYLQEKRYQDAVDSYRTASRYVDEDPLLHELLGYSLYLNGEKPEGVEQLKRIADVTPDHLVSSERLAQEVIDGVADEEAVEAIFMYVDEKRSSLMEKKRKLESILDRTPRFSTGWFALAATLLQLHQEGEALALLEHYHLLNPRNPSAEYMLTVLNAKRMNFPTAWEHYEQTEALLKARSHNSKLMRELYIELWTRSPKTRSKKN